MVSVVGFIIGQTLILLNHICQKIVHVAIRKYQIGLMKWLELMYRRKMIAVGISFHCAKNVIQKVLMNHSKLKILVLHGQTQAKLV